jgi:hypothetical protein
MPIRVIVVGLIFTVAGFFLDQWDVDVGNRLASVVTDVLLYGGL